MDVVPPRPRYRLHAFTWIVASITGVLGALIVLPGEPVAILYRNNVAGSCWYRHGWPLVFYERNGWDIPSDAKNLRSRAPWTSLAAWKWSRADDEFLEFSPVNLAIDLAAAVACVVLVAAVAEWWQRRRISPWQFHLKDAAVASVIAVLPLVWWRVHWQQTQGENDAEQRLMLLHASNQVTRSYIGPRWLARLTGESLLPGALWHIHSVDLHLERSADFQGIQRSVVRLPMLTSLTAQGANDDVIRLLPALGQLEVLWLNEFNPDPSRQITDQCLAAIGAMPNLFGLSIESQEISDAGLEHLADLTGLRQLDITSRQISEAGLVGLHGNLPSCYLTLWRPNPDGSRTEALRLEPVEQP